MIQNPETDLSAMRLIRRSDPAYPARLAALPGMPEELYVIGSLPAPDKPTAAIVGARTCSTYGRIQAFHFAKVLSQSGVQIISGLALGIDAEGHKGALSGGTPTFAVMGCGANVCYPSSNRPLYHRILRCGGGIISEFPPDTPAISWHFPVRNRIISGLADLVLVAEARRKSGSLITAQYALEQGKSVYAIPGAVNDPLGEGANRLIYDGAGAALEPADLLYELGVPVACIPEPETEDAGDEVTRLILASFGPDAESDLSIMEKTKLPLRTVQQELIRLLLAGRLREVGRNLYTPVR